MRRDRVLLALKVLEELGLMDKLQVSDFNVDDGDMAVSLLRLFHTDEYIRFVKRLSDEGEGLLDYGDTPAFPGCFEVYSHVVKASYELCSMLVHTQHVVNLYGGLHHAHPTRASGFCIFNDIGVAIHRLRQMGLKRIAYVDIDAHHGDGVMYPFYSDPELLIIDFHEDGRYLFPGTGSIEEMGEGEGTGSKVNVVLPPGAGDQDYLYAYTNIAIDLIKSFKPQVIILQAGVDAHLGDPLAHLELTDSGYLKLVSLVHGLSHELCGGRIVVFGGGGYMLGSTARCWAGSVAVLVGNDVNNISAATSRVFEKMGYEYSAVGLSWTGKEVLAETKRAVEKIRVQLSRLGYEFTSA
jgi:acetoin utilization protein AcuC